MVGCHLELECLGMIVYGQWGQRMKTKVCLPTLDPWDSDDFTLLASLMPYDDNDCIYDNGCVGIMRWWVFIDVMTMTGKFLAVSVFQFLDFFWYSHYAARFMPESFFSWVAS